MAKTRLDLLREELNLCIEVIEQQFIERDIALLLQREEDIESVNDEIRNFMQRKEALEALLQAEEEKAEGRVYRDFVGAVVIVSSEG